MSDYLKANMDNLTKLILPYEPTQKQADLMLHAIGADSRKARRYKQKYFYHAYRNGFDADGDDVAEWDELVKMHLAIKKRTYHVTLAGINVLEVLTNSTIYLVDCVGDAKPKVLTYLIKNACYCGYGCWIPVPIWVIADRVHAPKRVVRETLQELVNDGLVVKTYYGECDDEGFPHCWHGWGLTDKARELDEYKQAWEEECRKIERGFESGEFE